jgi:hypothetical protein
MMTGRLFNGEHNLQLGPKNKSWNLNPPLMLAAPIPGPTNDNAVQPYPFRG